MEEWTVDGIIIDMYRESKQVNLYNGWWFSRNEWHRMWRNIFSFHVVTDAAIAKIFLRVSG